MVCWQGCAWHPLDTFIKKTVTGTEISGRGPAAIPAKHETIDRQTTIPLLPGSTVTISTAAPIPTVAQAAGSNPTAPLPAVVLSEHGERATAPTNYAPPAPPSAGEQADADGKTKFYWLAVICAAAGIFAAWREHFRAAGILLIAAAGIPALIYFGHLLAASHLATGSLAAAAAFVAAWHFLQNHPEIEARIKARLTAT